MKKFWTLCIVTALSTISLFVLSYEGGRKGMPIAIFNLPAQLARYLINFICLASSLILLFIALVKRQNIRATIAPLLLSTAFAAIGFIVPPIKVFQLGFRNGVKSRVSPNELRQIARVIQEKVPPDQILPGPGKHSLWTENEHAPLWTMLTNSTALGKLDSSVVVYQRPGEVDLLWGGALVGHWGVRIENEPTSAGDIAPGISTFMPD